jgi:hypothetical protein
LDLPGSARSDVSAFIIFIGGSHLDGVEAATRQFIRRLNEADAAWGQLTIGRITNAASSGPGA